MTGFFGGKGGVAGLDPEQGLKVLDTDVTQSHLRTITVPANQLNNDGDMLIAEFHFVTLGTNQQDLTVNYGGTAVVSAQKIAGNAAGDDALVRVVVVRTGASAQRVSVYWVGMDSGASDAIFGVTFSDLSKSNGSAQDLDANLGDSADGDCQMSWVLVQGTSSAALQASNAPRLLESVIYEASPGTDRTHTIPGGTFANDGDVVDCQFHCSRSGGAGTIQVDVDGTTLLSNLGDILNATGESAVFRLTLHRVSSTELVAQIFGVGANTSDETGAKQAGFTVTFSGDIDVDITVSATIALGSGFLAYWPAP